jgi:hypothetical protein
MMRVGPSGLGERGRTQIRYVVRQYTKLAPKRVCAPLEASMPTSPVTMDEDIDLLLCIHGANQHTSMNISFIAP